MCDLSIKGVFMTIWYLCVVYYFSSMTLWMLLDFMYMSKQFLDALVLFL